MISGFMAKTR